MHALIPEIIDTDWVAQDCPAIIRAPMATWLANQISDETRRAYRTDVEQFLKRFRSAHPADITVEMVIAWRDELRAAGRKPTTIARKLSSLSGFLEWLCRERLIVENPVERVAFPKVSSEGQRRPLSRSEARTLIDTPDAETVEGPLHVAVLATLLHTGCRRAEIARLKIGDLGEERGQRTLRVFGKRAKIRVIVLHPKAWRAIETYLKAGCREHETPDAPLFTSLRWRGTNKGRPLSVSQIYRIVRGSAEAAELGRRSPHDARATACTAALDAGAQPERIADHFGWSGLAMVMRYRGFANRVDDSIACTINY